jgi:hypothetical protein
MLSSPRSICSSTASRVGADQVLDTDGRPVACLPAGRYSVIIRVPARWGSSSAGRAPRSQRGGRGFKSLLLHQIRSQVRNGGCSMGSNRGATSRLTPRRFERSACPGNESRNARFHNRIEPDSRSDFLSDLFDGVIGNSRDIKILLDVIAVRSRGQKRRPSLDRPG